MWELPMCSCMVAVWECLCPGVCVLKLGCTGKGEVWE